MKKNIKLVSIPEVNQIILDRKLDKGMYGLELITDPFGYDGGYMEQVFDDESKWIRMSINRKDSINDTSLIFIRKKALDKVLAKQGTKKFVKRYKEYETSDENYIIDFFYELFDPILLKVKGVKEKHIKDLYVNIYDYIIEYLFKKQEKRKEK